MKGFAIALMVFWAVIILFPAILVFLIWGFFIIAWLNLFVFVKQVHGKKKDEKDYIKFWDYKIYR